MPPFLLPWIMVSRGVEPSTGTPPPGGASHAVFALRIKLLPHSTLSTLQWGWNLGALLEEAQDRQRLFIEAQHPAQDLPSEPLPIGRALALRCLRRPAESEMTLTLLGKVQASNAEAALAAAQDYALEIQSTFPIDYELAALQSAEEFRHRTGWDLVQASQAVGSLTEIRRFEGTLTTGNGGLNLLGQWTPTLRANEQIWRVLAACPTPILFNVTLSPTYLFEQERQVLVEITEAARKASGTAQASIRMEAEWNARLFAERQSQLRYPYLVQVQLAAPQGAPAFVARAIGSALMHCDSHMPNTPGYWLRQPERAATLAAWRQGLEWLEPCLDGDGVTDQRLVRLRYLMSSREAHAVFRLPFPPKAGLRGVAF